jgi:soluble lytic murein transglycosylase-like protein
MRDSVDPYWQRAVTAAFPQGFSEAPSYWIVGSVGLLALAVSMHRFIPDKLIQRDVSVPAYEARQTAAGDRADSLSKGDLVCVADGKQLPAHLQQGNHQFRASLTAYIGGNYRVPGALAHEIVDATFAVSRKYNMDPLLVLGIIAKESSFNHKARSGYGATGLMQIHAPSHQALLKEIGIQDRNPKVVEKKLTSKVRLNVTAGIRIYKTYEKQYGSAAKALQAYNGAKHDPSQRYAKNVLAMREDFKQMALRHGACG